MPQRAHALRVAPATWHTWVFQQSLRGTWNQFPVVMRARDRLWIIIVPLQVQLVNASTNAWLMAAARVILRRFHVELVSYRKVFGFRYFNRVETAFFNSASSLSAVSIRSHSSVSTSLILLASSKQTSSVSLCIPLLKAQCSKVTDCVHRD